MLDFKSILDAVICERMLYIHNLIVSPRGPSQ